MDVRMRMSASTASAACFGTWDLPSGNEAVIISSVRAAFQNASSFNETEATRSPIKFGRSVR